MLPFYGCNGHGPRGPKAVGVAAVEDSVGYAVSVLDTLLCRFAAKGVMRSQQVAADGNQTQEVSMTGVYSIRSKSIKRKSETSDISINCKNKVHADSVEDSVSHFHLLASTTHSPSSTLLMLRGTSNPDKSSRYPSSRPRSHLVLTQPMSVPGDDRIKPHTST